MGRLVGCCGGCRAPQAAGQSRVPTAVIEAGGGPPDRYSRAVQNIDGRSAGPSAGWLSQVRRQTGPPGIVGDDQVVADPRLQHYPAEAELTDRRRGLKYCVACPSLRASRASTLSPAAT